MMNSTDCFGFFKVSSQINETNLKNSLYKEKDDFRSDHITSIDNNFPNKPTNQSLFSQSDSNFNGINPGPQSSPGPLVNGSGGYHFFEDLVSKILDEDTNRTIDHSNEEIPSSLDEEIKKKELLSQAINTSHNPFNNFNTQIDVRNDSNTKLSEDENKKNMFKNIDSNYTVSTNELNHFSLINQNNYVNSLEKINDPICERDSLLTNFNPDPSSFMTNLYKQNQLVDCNSTNKKSCGIPSTFSSSSSSFSPSSHSAFSDISKINKKKIDDNIFNNGLIQTPLSVSFNNNNFNHNINNISDFKQLNYQSLYNSKQFCLLNQYINETNSHFLLNGNNASLNSNFSNYNQNDKNSVYLDNVNQILGNNENNKLIITNQKNNSLNNNLNMLTSNLNNNLSYVNLNSNNMININNNVDNINFNHNNLYYPTNIINNYINNSLKSMNVNNIDYINNINCNKINSNGINSNINFNNSNGNNCLKSQTFPLNVDNRNFITMNNQANHNNSQSFLNSNNLNIINHINNNNIGSNNANNNVKCLDHHVDVYEDQLNQLILEEEKISNYLSKINSSNNNNSNLTSNLLESCGNFLNPSNSSSNGMVGINTSSSSNMNTNSRLSYLINESFKLHFRLTKSLNDIKLLISSSTSSPILDSYSFPSSSSFVSLPSSIFSTIEVWLNLVKKVQARKRQDHLYNMINYNFNSSSNNNVNMRCNDIKNNALRYPSPANQSLQAVKSNIALSLSLEELNEQTLKLRTCVWSASSIFTQFIKPLSQPHLPLHQQQCFSSQINSFSSFSLKNRELQQQQSFLQRQNNSQNELNLRQAQMQSKQKQQNSFQNNLFPQQLISQQVPLQKNYPFNYDPLFIHNYDY